MKRRAKNQPLDESAALPRRARSGQCAQTGRAAKLSARQRQTCIIEHLRDNDTVDVATLADLLSVSLMTVHRDLDSLANERIVRKVRGGATLQPSVVFEADYAYRSRLGVAAKEALGVAAAALIDPGMAIMIDDSSTTAAMLPHLIKTQPLTVVTNALPVICNLSERRHIKVIATGGVLDPVTNAFTGLVAERSLRAMRADLALFSTACVHGATAYLHDPDVVRTKRAMMDSAEKCVLLVDSSKFGRSALNMFADLAEFDEVLTTSGLSVAQVNALEAAGVTLKTVNQTAPVPSPRSVT